MRSVEEVDRNAGRSERAAWVTLAVLASVCVYSILDRIIINLMVEPIKADFHLTDTQFSLLQGVAFLFIYSIAALPVGYMVDRINRVRLVGSGTALWSLMTGLCGVAPNFGFLFLARFGVGVGEAVLAPAAYSLLADNFRKERYSLVFSLYTAAATIGGGTAWFLGGYLLAALQKHGSVEVPILGLLKPWRTAFLILSLAGIIIVAIVLLLRDPRTARAVLAPRVTRNPVALWQFLRMNKGTLILHHSAVGISNMAAFGVGAWIVPFFIRTYGWKIGEIGFATGIAVAVGGTVGLLGGGLLGDAVMRWGAHNRLLVCAAAVMIAAVLGLIFPLTGNPMVAIVLFGGVIGFGTIPMGVANAALQFLTPSEVRGSVSSIFFCVLNMITALGPTVFALVSDHLFPSQDGLRHTFALVLPSCLMISALLFLACTFAYKRALRSTGQVVAT